MLKSDDHRSLCGVNLTDSTTRAEPQQARDEPLPSAVIGTVNRRRPNNLVNLRGASLISLAGLHPWAGQRMGIRQFASELKLSVSTFSRALNDSDEVSAETRERVRAAALAHGGWFADAGW